MARLVIICLTGVSRGGTGHHFPPRGGEIVLVTFFHLVSPGAGGLVRVCTGVWAFWKEHSMVSNPFAFPTTHY